jgi:hypothetical protein
MISKNSSDPIYFANLHNQSRAKWYILPITTIIITSVCIFVIVYLQINDLTLSGGNGICFENENYINVFSIPIAGCLIIFYIFLFKRRVFLRNKFKFKYIGLPMIVSCWNKENRLFSSFIYGLMALNVFEILSNSIQNKSNDSKIYSFEDPTGLLSLFIKIIEIILIGLSNIIINIMYYFIIYLILNQLFRILSTFSCQ